MDGAPALPDAGPDATPPPGAIVQLTPDAYLPAAGGDVTVSWTSELATSCTVTASSGETASGAAGDLVVTVDELTRVIAVCDPPGRASVAAISLAPRCEGETVLMGLQLWDDGQIRDGDGTVIEEPPGCLVVEGTLSLFGGRPDVAARVRSVSGLAFEQEAGRNGLDLVSLETTGTLGMDYMNGYFPPFEGVEFTYLGYPSLVDPGNSPLSLADGRADLRALQRGALSFVTHTHLEEGTVEVIELADGVTLTSILFDRTEARRAPMILGQPAGVSGDVTITANSLLPHAEAQALVDALGQIDGTVTICGNLDDDPCP